jgi:hypothetical protein
VDPGTHKSEKLDPDPHESQNSRTGNGAIEGRGRSQMEAWHLREKMDPIGRDADPQSS